MFTRVVAAALAPLHEEGIRVMPYLDDWLIQAASREQAARDTARVVSHVQGLGLRVNWEKSMLTPSQRVTFVGMTLDSVSMVATLPPETSGEFARLRPGVPHRGSDVPSPTPEAFGPHGGGFSCGSAGLA